MGELEARRVTALGHESVLLANGEVRTVVDAIGSMMPEFGRRAGSGTLNAHWLPDFRDATGTPFVPGKHAAHWKAKLLWDIAGDFTCSPGFGPGCTVDGVELPPHGFTANDPWSIDGVGVDRDLAAAWARFSLESPAAGMPLTWLRSDLVLDGQPAYYSVTTVKNRGAKPIAVNLARHNTLGPPFLQAGCRISLCARRFMSAPSGTEFDPTGRLAQGAEFDDLARAPLRSGGTADLTLVPGMIGHSDFVTGPVQRELGLGWSCVVNPVLKLAYLCFFPGPAATPEGEVALSFNDLWLQYGGRPFGPWAMYEGGADRTFCLGTENAVGCFANGLAASRAMPELLGAPTLITVPAGGERTLFYGTALVPLDDALVAEGVQEVAAEEGALVLRGAKASQRVKLDGGFGTVRRVASAIAGR